MPDAPVKPTQESVDNKTTQPQSQLMSVSVRGWLALLVVFTICAMSLARIPVTEPLLTIGGMIVAFYYGQNKPK